MPQTSDSVGTEQRETTTAPTPQTGHVSLGFHLLFIQNDFNRNYHLYWYTLSSSEKNSTLKVKTKQAFRSDRKRRRKSDTRTGAAHTRTPPPCSLSSTQGPRESSCGSGRCGNAQVNSSWWRSASLWPLRRLRAESSAQSFLRCSSGQSANDNAINK